MTLIPVSPRARRPGVILVIAIVCIAVASVIFLAVLRTAVAERGALRAEAWRQQALWLAESGVERAAARLAADSGYQGETWNVPADQLAADTGGVVEIEVQAVPQRPDHRLVRVRADFPDDPQHRARKSKQVLIQLRPSS